VKKLLYRFSPLLYTYKVVIVSLAQLVWTLHNICKVRDSKSGHHQNIHLQSYKLIQESRCRDQKWGFD